MELKREFVLAATGPGANVAQLCRDFGISRNNGYKWIRRFKAEGKAGLQERSRRPRQTCETSGEVVLRLIELRRQYPKWGPKKLHALLITGGYRGALPSTKTIARILDRAGEERVRKPRRRLRLVLREREDLDVSGPNDVWTVDFKGWWRTRNGKRFEPLTIRDAFSRYVLCLRMLSSMAATAAKPVFERLFETHGLPKVIRVDNGAPFACTSAPAGLSRLSAWWTSLGIRSRSVALHIPRTTVPTNACTRTWPTRWKPIRLGLRRRSSVSQTGGARSSTTCGPTRPSE